MISVKKSLISNTAALWQKNGFPSRRHSSSNLQSTIVNRCFVENLLFF